MLIRVAAQSHRHAHFCPSPCCCECSSFLVGDWSAGFKHSETTGLWCVTLPSWCSQFLGGRGAEYCELGPRQTKRCNTMFRDMWARDHSLQRASVSFSADSSFKTKARGPCVACLKIRQCVEVPRIYFHVDPLVLWCHKISAAWSTWPMCRRRCGMRQNGMATRDV